MAVRADRARRQAGCMAKTEKRHKPQRLPKEVTDAVAAAEDKKAVDIALLDLRKAAGFADYFLICSGTNARQIRAIADGIIEALASAGSKPAHVEGLRAIRMDPSRLLRFHRAHLRARDARVLRPRAAVGERGAGRASVPGRIDGQSHRVISPQSTVSPQSWLSVAAEGGSGRSSDCRRTTGDCRRCS